MGVVIEAWRGSAIEVDVGLAAVGDCGAAAAHHGLVALAMAAVLGAQRPHGRGIPEADRHRLRGLAVELEDAAQLLRVAVG